MRLKFVQFDKEFQADLYDLVIDRALKLDDDQVTQKKQFYICLAMSEVRLEREEIVSILEEAKMSVGEVSGEELYAIQIEAFSEKNYQRVIDNKKEKIKSFGTDISAMLRKNWGHDCVFVPFEHFDVKKNKAANPREVYEFESDQVKNNTSCLIVIADDPTWGGGMELGWCDILQIPIIIINEAGRYISRLMRGSPMVIEQIKYSNKDQVVSEVELLVKKMIHQEYSF